MLNTAFLQQKYIRIIQIIEFLYIYYKEVKFYTKSSFKWDFCQPDAWVHS